MEKKTAFILIALALVAFFLRWYLMPSHLFFGPEQGRDFLVIRDIVQSHKLTLIGSKTDIDGIFHGPAYYYLASIPFAIFGGNPLGVAAFLILIQCLSVFLAYELVYEITKSKRGGIVAGVLFATGYLFVEYARWISNPPISIPLSLLFILCLLRFVRGRQWYLVATALVYGLIGQIEFINYLLFAIIGTGTILMYWKTLRKTKMNVIIAAAAVGFVTSLLHYVLFDLRHEFLISKAVGLLLSGKSGYHIDFLPSIVGAFQELFEQASRIVGLTGWIPGLIIMVCIVFTITRLRKKEPMYRIIAFWIFAPPVIFALLRHAMLVQLYAGVIAGLLIGLALFLERVMRWNMRLGMIILFLIIAMNIGAIGKNLPSNRNMFFQAAQPAVRYSDQLAAIDWAYSHAQGKPFSFQAYTIPYFWQDGWTYLLGYYGNKKYGYLPDDKGRKLMYVVIQKDTLDPGFQKTWYEKTVSTWGRRTNEETIGIFRVEELAVDL